MQSEKVVVFFYQSVKLSFCWETGSATALLISWQKSLRAIFCNKGERFQNEPPCWSEWHLSNYLCGHQKVRTVLVRRPMLGGVAKVCLKTNPVDANDVKYLHFQVVCVLVHSLDKCSTSGWRIELTKGRL